MADNKLADMSTEFAIQILRLTDIIKRHYSLSNQFERSGTSIGLKFQSRQILYLTMSQKIFSTNAVLFVECSSPQSTPQRRM